MIFDGLQQLLGEFFVDIQEENVSLYTGDLFEPSHFKLSDVFLKTSLINSLQLPFELSAGYIGNVKVEGLLGAVAGWPLEVKISDICLVLKPNKVPWENELLIRYAKELIVAICQSFGAPSETKKDKTSFTSPTKWIWSRVQAAEMTVQLERIHIRVESERSDNLVAYGLYIPLIRLASRDVEEQILYRRQQPGVTYPKASETLMSKLLTIENVSFYTDLDAESYWTVATNSKTSSRTEHPVAAALISSPEVDISLGQYTHKDALRRLKECALKPFARDKRRELVFIRVVWVKLDFVREENEKENGRLVKPVLAAVDVATEEIDLNLDFDQIAMILEELEHVVEYFKRARMWQWRPSCIDRERHAPPSVKTLRNYMLPLPPLSEEDHSSLIFSVDKQRKPKLWFRAMWRYAFRCIIDQQQRSRKETSRTDQVPDPAFWWQYNEFDDKELQEIRRQRYMHLYARNLGPAAMEIALYGRKKVLVGFMPQLGSVSEDHSPSSSPRRRPLPEFDPLTQEELWELSDFVATMPVYEQRVCRALAERELRADFTAAPPSPTRRVSSTMEFSVAPLSRHSRSHSVDSQPTTPAVNLNTNEGHLIRGSERTPAPPSPTRKVSIEVSEAPADSQFRHGRSHSVDFNANERHLLRGSTIAFGAAELAVHHEPPMSRPHAASTSVLPSPTKHENALNLEPLRAWIYKQRKLGLHTTSWFEKQFFPASILNPSKVIPLLNWQIGPVKVHLSEGTSDHELSIKRGIGIEVGIKSCSGAILLTRTPFLQILVEIRFGLFHVTLVRQPHPHNGKNDANSENTTAEYKWISSDYIRSPEDGFLYIGLKYSAQEVAKPTGRVQFAGNLEEELGLKGRMCIGPLKIDCNEAAMRMAMGQTVADDLRATNMNVSTSTHFSVLQDAYHSFVGLVAHLPKRKGSRQGHTSSPRATNKPGASNAAIQAISMLADQQKLDKTAKRTRMLHALLLRSSTFEVEVGALELNLSAFTSHIEKTLLAQGSKSIDASNLPETLEDVTVMLPTTTYRLQNRPAINECIMDVAGARVVYRSTKQGRAAVIRHLAQLLQL